MATANSKTQEPGARDDLKNLAEGLAVPPGVASPDAATEVATQSLANAPDAPLDVVQKAAVAADLSGETVRIVLNPSEGKEGKEAQFVRVNAHTWLIPRSNPTIVPVEAYEALTDTLPPVQEGGDDFYSPRFSVSVRERFPAPQR